MRPLADKIAGRIKTDQGHAEADGQHHGGDADNRNNR